MPRKTFRRKKRVMKKRVYRKRRLQNNLHSFKRTFQATAIGITGGVVSYGATSFKLTDLPNYTEFQNLYDMYRIKAVKIRWLFNHNNSEAGSGNPDTLPNFYSVVDYDDDNAPANVAELLQYPRCRIRRLGNPKMSDYFKPRVSSLVYKTALTTGYAMGARNTWLDMSNADIPYFAFKYALDPVGSSSGSVGYLCPVITYYFQCKGTR